MANKETVAGYFPVIHDGYLRLLNIHENADVAVFDETILGQFDYLRKDIRALKPADAERLIRGYGRTVRLIGSAALHSLMESSRLVMPDDDISRELLEKYPNDAVILEPVFLRWHRENVKTNVEVLPDRTVMLDSDDQIIMQLVNEAKKSTNWWRRVGAAVVDLNGTTESSAHNSSVPTPYTSAIDGDPRITARRGESIETSIDIHAESRLIAHLAKSGVSTEGKSLYVTTFPCPNCAKLIAESGIASCYFMEGYATLDGYDVLKAAEIEIVQITTDLGLEDMRTLKPYPSN